MWLFKEKKNTEMVTCWKAAAKVSKPTICSAFWVASKDGRRGSHFGYYLSHTLCYPGDSTNLPVPVWWMLRRTAIGRGNVISTTCLLLCELKRIFGGQHLNASINLHFVSYRPIKAMRGGG